jgi:hypothetical protein
LRDGAARLLQRATTRTLERMTYRLAAVIFGLITLLPCYAQESQQILIQEFSSWRSPKVERRNGRLALEVCKDQCNYYTARVDTPEQALWDIALLHHLYFNREFEADKLRARYSKAGDAVVRLHDGGCSGKEQTLMAQCVLQTLSKKYNVRVAFVRYDEGQRCEVAASLIDPSWLGTRTRCTKIR